MLKYFVDMKEFVKRCTHVNGQVSGFGLRDGLFQNSNEIIGGW